MGDGGVRWNMSKTKPKKTNNWGTSGRTGKYEKPPRRSHAWGKLGGDGSTHLKIQFPQFGLRVAGFSITFLDSSKIWVGNSRPQGRGTQSGAGP